MRSFLPLLLLLMLCSNANAQINAITETGKQVILNYDGTWKYVDDGSPDKSETDSMGMNPEKFTKSSAATFLVKSGINTIGIYINPKKWTFSGHRDNETNPEYRFSSKSGDLSAMIVTERLH